jgi:hypothetical protein
MPSSAAASKIRLAVLPGQGQAHHLALMRHRGGGWWDVQCMGSGKRCKAGECAHTRGLGLAKPDGPVRPVRQVPREEARDAR